MQTIRSRRPLALTLAALAGLVVSPVGGSDAVPGSSIESAVEAYLAPYVETGNYSGAVLLARGDRVLLSRGYGLASRELDVPNRATTRFHLASASKPFTVAAVLTLVEQGRLDLDAPLAKVLPDYPRGDELTVHHLLSNTSGIPNINSFDEFHDAMRRAQNPESLVAFFRDRPLAFSPGERSDYSNSNFNLLAYIIEQLSGQPYGDFLEQSLFVPLKLAATGHHGDESQVIPQAAVGYAASGVSDLVRAPWIDWSAKTGNASIYSTTGDLHRFVRALFGGELLEPNTVERMLTEHTEHSGYGWFVRPRHGREQVHINGRSPGFSSYVGYYPEEQLTVVVLSNTYNSVTTGIGVDLAAMVFGEPYERPALRTTPLPAAAAKRLLGRYQFGPEFYRPNGEMEIHVDDKGFLHGNWGALVAISETEFFDRGYWTKMRFEIGDDDRATTLWIDEHRGERLPD